MQREYEGIGTIYSLILTLCLTPQYPLDMKV